MTADDLRAAAKACRELGSYSYPDENAKQADLAGSLEAFAEQWPRMEAVIDAAYAWVVEPELPQRVALLDAVRALRSLHPGTTEEQP